MKITTQHSASSFGIPVILDDHGELLDYPAGLVMALDRLGWTSREFANRLNVSVRTVEGWRIGRKITFGALYVLGDALEKIENKLELSKKKSRKNA